MNYRLLPSEEWDRLDALIPIEFLPRSEVAVVAVAEDETSGKITGCLFLQLALHAEPLVIQNAGVNFKRLAGIIHQALEGQPGLRYFCISTSDKVDRMAEIAGFHRIDGALYAREV